MREAFRHFRTDRIEGAAFLDERFEGRRGGLRRDRTRRLQGRQGVRLP